MLIYTFAKPRKSACKTSVDTTSHNAPVRLHASGSTSWMVKTTLYVVMQLNHMSSNSSEPTSLTNRTVLRKSPSEFDNASWIFVIFADDISAVEYVFDPMFYQCLAQIPRYPGAVHCREAVQCRGSSTRPAVKILSPSKAAGSQTHGRHQYFALGLVNALQEEAYLSTTTSEWCETEKHRAPAMK